MPVKTSPIKVNNFKDYSKIVTLLDTFIFTSLDHIMRQRGKKQEINNKNRYLVSARISEASRF